MYRALKDRIIVRRLPTETMTKGGLYIPAVAQQKMRHGAVLAVGPGRCDFRGNMIAMDVQEGDYVLFGQSSGTEIEDGEDLLSIPAGEIIARRAPGHAPALLGDNVLLRPLDAHSSTIVVPDACLAEMSGDKREHIPKHNQLALAEVLAVGCGWPWQMTRAASPDEKLSETERRRRLPRPYAAERRPPPLHPGERVMYQRAAAIDFDAEFVRGYAVDGGHFVEGASSSSWRRTVVIREGAIFVSVEGHVMPVIGGLRSA